MNHSSGYPQGAYAEELKRAGHTVYIREDGPHHDTSICGKCRADSAHARKGVRTE